MAMVVMEKEMEMGNEDQQVLHKPLSWETITLGMETDAPSLVSSRIYCGHHLSRWSTITAAIAPKDVNGDDGDDRDRGGKGDGDGDADGNGDGGWGRRWGW